MLKNDSGMNLQNASVLDNHISIQQYLCTLAYTNLCTTWMRTVALCTYVLGYSLEEQQGGHSMYCSEPWMEMQWVIKSP